MLKRIGYSFIYFIVYAVISFIVGKIMGNTDCGYVAIAGAIGAFTGAFVGYGFGKADKDDEN